MPTRSSAKAGSTAGCLGALAPTPELAQGCQEPEPAWSHQKATTALAALGAPVDQPVDDENGPSSCTPPPRQATPHKQALWKAIQHARLQGVPLRGIARQLGISRNTVRKYVDLPAPPVKRTPSHTTQSVTQHHTNGHFP